ncbi:ATP-binding cassette domain-containing protein [candidate division KSB1 bacterium]|nr:ATP-binding cassette domain-containing protein [candidate division KSB1 bacterium]RQW02600.1 MAG: ATP-binding cassette domain-containing protein [candidate division KSB1 bacterium]
MGTLVADSLRTILLFIARIKGVPQHIMDSHIDSLLKTVRLFDERDKLTSQLSQGMRKKLAIAAARVHSPKIVFLDEALNGIHLEERVLSLLKD